MFTATCPHPITSLPPLLSPSSLEPEPEVSQPKPVSESAPSELAPMPVKWEALPFHLDPRRGTLTNLNGGWSG